MHKNVSLMHVNVRNIALKCVCFSCKMNETWKVCAPQILAFLDTHASLVIICHEFKTILISIGKVSVFAIMCFLFVLKIVKISK